ncbi:prepilin-type N-terminal cleavage/methylation domain-containing protein [Geobacter sp. DSM 9736]|uniref:prepilin-type N-terminal cleavage/methylation domain-containing protein n=1 Tax=Geobacter sp. DSM 9736 TaxID=1277350 RepID=UPI001E32DC55|nr:prepilin-type N-terminal cleavage/methylation domain-containing protein [Geobacter sp. DSM 9736]
MKARLLSSNGFTLIEMVVAMVILIVGLLGLLQAVNVAMEHNLRGGLRDRAVAVGEQQMHNLMKLKHFDPIPQTFAQFTTVSVKVGAGSRNFRIERTRQALTSRVPEDSYRLRVNVRWAFKNMTTNHEVVAVVSR